MDDVAGFTYDYDAACHFIRVATGIAADDVAKFMAAKTRYELGLGVVPPDGADDVRTRDALGSAYPWLFPPDHIANRVMSDSMLARFVELDAGLDAAATRSMMTAELAYLRRVGIID